MHGAAVVVIGVKVGLMAAGALVVSAADLFGLVDVGLGVVTVAVVGMDGGGRVDGSGCGGLGGEGRGLGEG